MSKSGFLERKNIERQVLLDIGLQCGRQQILDMMTLALRDPNVVGKDTFGKKRLLKLVNAIGKNLDNYWPAWQKTDETDYYRAKMDCALTEAYGEEMHDSFLKRYEFLQDFDYSKRKWK